MGLFSVLVGWLAPIELSASKLFDQTILKNGIDWRCLKPDVKKEVVALAIKMAEFTKFPVKPYVAETVELAANQISRYIIHNEFNESDPFVSIFKKHHNRQDFKPVNS
ncbi:hypothetical protein ACP3VZ_13235 [Vibrio sp. PNB22_2_2]